MRLRSCVAVAVGQASSCRSDLTPSLGTSICYRCGPKKQSKKKKKYSINFLRESLLFWLFRDEHEKAGLFKSE